MAKSSASSDESSEEVIGFLVAEIHNFVIFQKKPKKSAKQAKKRKVDTDSGSEDSGPSDKKKPGKSDGRWEVLYGRRMYVRLISNRLPNCDVSKSAGLRAKLALTFVKCISTKTRAKRNQAGKASSFLSILIQNFENGIFFCRHQSVDGRVE
jgi:hypothetical protein